MRFYRSRRPVWSHIHCPILEEQACLGASLPHVTHAGCLCVSMCLPAKIKHLYKSTLKVFLQKQTNSRYFSTNFLIKMKTILIVLCTGAPQLGRLNSRSLQQDWYIETKLVFSMKYCHNLKDKNLINY